MRAALRVSRDWRGAGKFGTIAGFGAALGRIRVLGAMGRLLSELENHADFVRRHIGPSAGQQAEMARVVGYGSVDELIEAAVPAHIRRAEAMRLGGARSEHAALERLREFAGRNRVFRSFIGCGYFDTFTPPVIQRNVLENPGWYTAYTPYQAEISQGRMEGLLNFQQMVMDLTGMNLANASMLDESTAAAEAMTMLRRVNKKNRSRRFIIAHDCHPQTIAVARTRAEPLDIEVAVGDPAALLNDAAAFGMLLQYPGTYGDISELAPLIQRAHAGGALVCVAADLMALLLLQSPGSCGADAVVGNSQRFGVPLGFGGPHAAFFATRDEYKRSAPGRIIGASIDSRSRRGLRMAMQTREQHIRREKATSNICTAQALLAVMAAFYAMYHGPEGLRRIALRIHRFACILRRGLEQLGFKAENSHFFDTLTFAVGDAQGAILERARRREINLRPVGSDRIGISLDETTERDDIENIWAAFSGAENTRGGLESARDDAEKARGNSAKTDGKAEKESSDASGAISQSETAPDLAAIDADLAGEDCPGIPAALRRDCDYLRHPVFNDYHSETDMLRYLKRLEDKDIALNRAMIPLGSCTMKLNGTAEMLALSWQEFARIHPFAPPEQTRGYQALLAELESMLRECTGYAAISFQPNAGSQGEYAGLLAIRGYHRARGEARRNVCLIPSSAHGTNPASAVLAGLKTVIVECDAAGNIDMADLRAKIDKHRSELACIMVTYPSTHGVFEEGIVELCGMIHEAGGQVYVDGANLNALVGLSAPGEFGADVSHLNLHKTFCIPHGGGGPGMGPIGVGEHLIPHLPGHPLDTGGDLPVIASAPFGSSSILTISWAYIALMGGPGLEHATRVAILNANYIARRLQDYFPILYTGRNGRVAHECIIDLRPLSDASGVSEEDIAKRLIDYGFHAPTMSFPVAGTLMIEPTESESRAELDRFCDAMIAIREEIRLIETGEMDAADNPLKNAPHTLADMVDAEWTHPYTRLQAAFPMSAVRAASQDSQGSQDRRAKQSEADAAPPRPAMESAKYWPPVNRIDNAYGDRNFVCSCPGIDSYRGS